MGVSDSEKWNRIYQEGKQSNRQAAQVLLDYQYLLPVSGTALDLACGRGANAILLAQHGLQTSAWDLSGTAIDQLNEYLEEHDIHINTEQKDVIENPPEPESFDVIVVSRFLSRDLVRYLIAALRLHGLIFYQTFTREKISGHGPTNPDYRLAENELLELFKSLRIVVYREEGNIGDTDKGFRNEAMLIAQKRY